MVNINNVKILVIEDDPGHSRLIEKNLRRANIINEIILLNDGKKALDYLFGEEESSGKEPVSTMIILLDLNLPVIDGFKVLEHIKNNACTKNIPVIILTTSSDSQEISRCYDLGCNVYITKPVAYEKFSDAIKKLGLFLSVADVPERS